MQEIIIEGIYRHHKNQNYKVLHVARHSENLEELVVYQKLYGDMSVWVRPLNMFLDKIEKSDGSIVNRFTYIGMEE